MSRMFHVEAHRVLLVFVEFQRCRRERPDLHRTVLSSRDPVEQILLSWETLSVGSRRRMLTTNASFISIDQKKRLQHNRSSPMLVAKMIKSCALEHFHCIEQWHLSNGLIEVLVPPLHVHENCWSEVRVSIAGNFPIDSKLGSNFKSIN